MRSSVIAVIRASGSLPSARNRSESQVRRPTRIVRPLPIERHVAAGVVDVGNELSAPELREFVNPGSLAVQCLDDGTITRLLLHGRELSSRNSWTSSCRRSARRETTFGKRSTVPTLNRSAPVLKPVVSNALIAESLRRRVPAEPVKVAAKFDRSPSPTVRRLRAPMKVRKQS
jgi:hypothetical protein